MTSLSLKLLDQKGEEHGNIFNSKERAKLQLLLDYLCSEEDENTANKSNDSSQDGDNDGYSKNRDCSIVAVQLEELLTLTNKVKKRVAKARKEEQTAVKLERTEKLIDQLVADREELFVEGPYANLLKTALKDARKQPEQVATRRERQQRKKEEERRRKADAKKRRELEKLQAEKEKENEKEEEEACRKADEEHQKRQHVIKIRRALQHKLAGHPSAKHLWFTKMRITEHAHFRWNDRGMPFLTLPAFLKQVDDGDYLYKLKQLAEGTWKTNISIPGSSGKLVFILDQEQSTIITMIHTGKSNKKYDRRYAPAGRIRAENHLVVESEDISLIQKSKGKRGRRKRR